ncbi:MAG: hypothetical protein IH924_08695 [Proteobacteria bacterium]|nr:hypothetical protein [Pseudomonadota bacterium]
MAQFRKKPVVVEAVRYSSTAKRQLSCVCNCVDGERPKIGQHHIHTLEGAHGLRDSDWIIKGVKGEFYPCKPDIFALTYDPV